MFFVLRLLIAVIFASLVSGAFGANVDWQPCPDPSQIFCC